MGSRMEEPGSYFFIQTQKIKEFEMLKNSIKSNACAKILYLDQCFFLGVLAF